VTGFLLSSLRLNKARDFIFYLLILFLPTQLGKHFWPEFSFIKGVRVDYPVSTLYFTDILILLLFLSWAFPELRIKNYELRIKSALKYWKIFTLLIFIFVGILLSKSPQAGFYGLVKFLEFSFLGFYVAKNISRLRLENILLIFSIGIIFESLLSISQYLNHGSLQGIFYFFGERFFTSLTPGIANASLGGELFLRPYGTFPHPNVLAGYLVIAMTLISSKFKVKSSKLRKMFYFASIILGTVALFLTLSRVAIILWVLILSFFLIRTFIIHHLSFIILTFVCLLLLGLVTPLGTRFTGIRLTDESIVQRENLIQSSIAMIKDDPLFGVGLNNFLVNLPSYQRPHTPLFYLQPVHNIYLLILTQTGIVGLVFFVWFIYKTYGRINDKGLRIKEVQPFIIYPLSLILILGMFDHYFLTLQQGQLLFAFILGLCWCEKPLK